MAAGAGAGGLGCLPAARRSLFSGRMFRAMAEKSVSTDSLAMTGSTYTGRRLRMAFIGCGGVTRFHMNALKHVPEIEVVAGCDIDPGRLEAFARDWGVT